MSRHPALSQVPDDLLFLGNRSVKARRRRALRLVAWLESRGWRPTALDLETERQRRATDHTNMKEHQ